MFYSNTFLARKGPLGTVWCAAHLQHRLKKSHITATNISFTVERIMFPEVPIALRMSGHLLLGVVRIFSKQIDYFLQDCNVLLIGLKRAYTSENVNLAENATHATLEAVTLPDNFQLDAMNLDDDFHMEGFHDDHLRSVEEITIEDQIPIGQDPYIVVSLDEDVIAKSSSAVGASSGSGPQPMEEESGPHTPLHATVAVQDPGPNNQETIEGPNDEQTPQSFPQVEVMRDATLDYRLEDVPFWPEQRDDQMEPDEVLMEIMKDKDNHIPDIEMVSGGPSLPSPLRQEPFSGATEQGHETFDSHVAFEHATPELALQPTPPAEEPRRRLRRKRRKYDESTVLSNRFMKQRLEDSSDILRKKKQSPCYALGIWKMSNRLKKDAVFFEPLMAGLCNDLHDAYKEDFVSSKPYLAVIEEDVPVVKEVVPPVAESTASMRDFDMEIERIRNYEIPAGTNTIPEIIYSPNRAFSSPNRLMPSPNTRDENTPVFDTDKGAWSEQVGTTIGTISDVGASTGPFGSDMETPLTFLEELAGVENTCLSDIPELGNSADEDLSFLAEDDYTPVGLQGTPDYFLRKHSGVSQADTLSVRTRAVAQFLKNKSSVTPTSESQPEELSLNKILDGKRKKICARMVFETLVLKNCGLIDLKQEEPFGEITLKVTPKLSKEFQRSVMC